MAFTVLNSMIFLHPIIHNQYYVFVHLQKFIMNK